MTTSQIRVPGTPPGWVNGLMRLMLHTPLIQRIVGKGFAEMTVTGAKTGHSYTTPVQYMRHDGEYVVLSQRTRTWWRNIATRPRVTMRVAGAVRSGRARIPTPAEQHSVLSDCLRADPRVARFYGLEPSAAADVADQDVSRLLDRFVVIVVTPIDAAHSPQPISVGL